MGKHRQAKGRPGSSRSDPIAKPIKPPADPELAALRESKILPVLKDLRSLDIKSRTAAAKAIANIIQDTKCRKLLLREQVVHTVLTETLTDNSLESRAAGWEILKVLAQEEESDFCVHLHRSDVLTAIEFAGNGVVGAITSRDQPFSKTVKAQQLFLWDIAASLIFLLNALATARDEILEAVVSLPQIRTFLFVLVASGYTPQEVLEDALSCLMTLAEDNLLFCQALIDDHEYGCYDKLLEFKAGAGSKAALACGVLHNAFSSLQWQDHSPGKDGASDALLVPTLSRLLRQTTLTDDATNGQQAAGVLQIALEVLASVGTDVQSTLERGNSGSARDARKSKLQAEQEEAGNVDDDGSGDDEDDDEAMEEDGGLDQSGDDGEMDSHEMDVDMGLVTGAGDDDTVGDSTLDDVPTLRELIQLAVPQLIRWSTTSPSSDEAVAIQNLALSALSNIAWSVSCIDFAVDENAAIARAWTPVAQKIWTKAIEPILFADTADVSLATTVTSLAWALSRTLGGRVPLGADEHRKFITLYQASKDLHDTRQGGAPGEESDPFQGLGVMCIGVLGQLARNPERIDLNREIGVFLVTLLAAIPNIPPADAVEGLNQMFDIYGDENAPYDKEVFWKNNFLKHLEGTLPKVKAMAKTIDKRTFGELRQRTDEAILNLGRFIQYKKKVAAKADTPE